MAGRRICFSFFFFNDTATTEIYTLSLHDALPISFVVSHARKRPILLGSSPKDTTPLAGGQKTPSATRSEEHTSELQSQSNIVCRLLLEKKKSDRTSINESNKRSLYRTL